jgi:hypothetical protein
MVGHVPLEDGIGVRVPDPQPIRLAMLAHGHGPEFAEGL